MKGITSPWHRVAAMLGVVLVLIVVAPRSVAQASTTTRPISDFVNAQGTYCIPNGSGGCKLFVPPVANFIGWADAKTNRGMSVDYAGLANAWITLVSGGTVSFGTTTSGTITERPLPDGRAEVDVRLHTENALTWVIACGPQLACDFATDPLLFGHRAPDVLNGQDAALGSSFMELRFINTAPGAPLPDLEQFLHQPLPGQELEFVAFIAHATGTLRAAFGVPDGTPGRASTTQTGLLIVGGKGVIDKGSFPSEHIDLQVTGG